MPNTSRAPAVRLDLSATVRLCLSVLLCVAALSLMSACTSAPPTAAVVQSPLRATPTTTTPEPSPTPTPILTPVPTATPAPTATPTATPSPIPSPTPTLTPTSTASPTATPTATPTPRPTSTPTAEQSAIAHLSTIVPWFASPPDEYHHAARTWITSLWLFNSELGDAVAKLPWVSDGIDAENPVRSSGAAHTEYDVLRSMGSVARKDTGLAEMLLNIWSSDGPNSAETAFITLLRDTAPRPDAVSPPGIYRLREDLLRFHDVQSATGFTAPRRRCPYLGLSEYSVFGG